MAKTPSKCLRKKENIEYAEVSPKEQHYFIFSWILKKYIPEKYDFKFLLITKINMPD